MTGDSDKIDFKPFLDMMIGVLFILLILIGAQIFFQRVDNVPVEEALRAVEAKRLVWDQEKRRLLDRIAGRLKSEGKIGAASDPDRRRVSADLAAVFRPAGDVEVIPAAARTVGRVLVEELGCVSDPTFQCPIYLHLKVRGIKPTVRVFAPPRVLDGLEPGAKARFVATAVMSEILKQTPAVLAIRGNHFGPLLVREESEITPGSTQSPAQSISGELILDFELD